MTNKMENINDVTMEKNYTVYMHVCPNGKVYIGITRRKPELRWSNGYGYKYNEYFWRAIQKYEWNNFEHIIIENNLTKEQAENMEIELIAKYRSNDREYGYNIESGGNVIGKTSKETIKKITDKCKFSKKTHCNGIIFNSVTECANYYRIKRCTMISWVNNRYPMCSEFKEMNLRFATENDLNECEKYDINKHGDKASDIKIIEHSKNVHCDNLIFNSITECANYYNLSASNISAWINGRNKMPLDFQKLNLRFATENDLNEYERYDINKHGDKASVVIKVNTKKSKYIYCDNLIFKSITDCANYYSIHKNTMSQWLRGRNKMPLDFQKLNLRYATENDLNTYPRYTPVNN